MLYRSFLCAALPVALLSLAAASADPDPRQAVADVMRHAAAHPDYAVDIDIAMVTRVQEREQRQEMRVEMQSRAEHDLFLRVVSGDDEAEVYRNAESRAVHFVKRKTYVLNTPPPSRIETMGTIGGSVIQLGARWLAGFLHGEEDLLDTATEIGWEAGEGDAAPALRLVYPDKVIRLWLSEDSPPRLARLRVDAGVGPAASNAGVTLSAEFDFGAWKTDVPANDARFAFAPPEGVRLVDPTRPPTRGAGLVGQPAPKVTLALLDGGTMDLGALQAEKKVVVLDFWATWCGPCHVGLPIVSEVAEAYADRGVVFYAVNRREAPDRIRGFLESKGHDYAVALDDQDEAARAYEVNAIPRTVIIDREGVVRAVHSGVGPRLKQEIAAELEKLTANSAG